VAGGNGVGTQLNRMIEERAKFDFGVTQDIRVWGAAGLVLSQEIAENTFFVLGREIDRLDINSDYVCNRNRIDEILPR